MILCTNDFSFFLSFSAVTTDTGIDTRALGSSQNELSIIKLAFALTVPGMFILCLGVNFLCYKWYSIRVLIALLFDKYTCIKYFSLFIPKIL